MKDPPLKEAMGKHLNQRRFLSAELQHIVLYLTAQTEAIPPGDWWANASVNSQGQLVLEGKTVIPEEIRDRILESLYMDPRTTGRRDRMFEHVNRLFWGISRRYVDKWLNDQESFQLTKVALKPRVTRAQIPQEPESKLECDLIDMSKYNMSNRVGGTRMNWLLTIVNTFTKFGWAYPLPSKSGPDVANAMRAHFQHIVSYGGIIEHSIQHDNGKEFLNADFQDVLKHFKVRSIRSKAYSPSSNGMIERLNGTIKRMLTKLMLANNDLNWVDLVESVMVNYNTTKHSVTGFRPADIHHGAPRDKVNAAREGIKKQAKKSMLYRVSPPVFRVGDRVRIQTRTFAKGIEAKRMNTWSHGIFTVDKVVPVPKDMEGEVPRYRLDNGTTYNPYELMKVNESTLVRTVQRQAVPVGWTRGDQAYFQVQQNRARTTDQKRKRRIRTGANPSNIIAVPRRRVQPAQPAVPQRRAQPANVAQPAQPAPVNRRSVRSQGLPPMPGLVRI